MTEILSLLENYSPTIAVLLILATAFLYVLKLVVDRSVAASFDTKLKELELKLQRRSAFEDKVLTDRFELVTSFSARLEAVMTNLNRIRSGLPTVPPEGFMEGNEIVTLTGIFVDLEVHRVVLGEEFYDLFTRQAQLALKFSNVGEQNEYKELAEEKVHLDEELRSSVDAAFSISTLSW